METVTDPSTTLEFLARNKRFYLEEEDNDLVEVANHGVSLERLYLRWRTFVVQQLFKRFAVHGLCLDVGCGTGLNLSNLPLGSIGIDINPRNLSKARCYASNAFLTQADMEALPFGDNVFDTVLFTEVLEHVPNPEVALREIWRVLRPRRVLIGIVPSDSLIWKLRFLSRHRRYEPYHRHYTRKQFLQVISALPLPFKVVLCRYAVPAPVRHLSMNIAFVLQKP